MFTAHRSVLRERPTARHENQGIKWASRCRRVACQVRPARMQLVLMIHLHKPGKVSCSHGSAATLKARGCQQDDGIPSSSPILTVLYPHVFRSVEGFRYTCQGFCGDDSAFKAVKITAVVGKEANAHEALHSASSAPSCVQYIICSRVRFSMLPHVGLIMLKP